MFTIGHLLGYNVEVAWPFLLLVTAWAYILCPWRRTEHTIRMLKNGEKRIPVKDD